MSCTRALRASRATIVTLGIASVFFCSASPASAMTACEAIKPTIENVKLLEMNAAGALFQARINPQNSPTTYEFVIVQQLRDAENL